jgi:hypothetical protein
MKEIKILTPVGMLGYGFPEDDFRRGLERNPDAVILDSGSTDPGPYMLGNGQTMVKPRAYERDLKIILSGLINRKIPLLIGSAGGAGSSENVDYIVETISAICNELGIHRKIVAISSDVDSKIVKERFHQGRIKSCSSAPDLTDKDIDESVRIVAQMGAEPILKALQDNPDADIIVAGRAYDPSPYAAYCMYRGIENSGIYWHMGKIMECGAFCCEQKGQVILATVREDSFDLEPMDPKNRCTEVSVAAHTLYEKTRPDLLPGPGGVLNLQKSHYEQLTDRVVRVGGSVFEKSPVYQVKLEGASVVGYRTTFIGGVRDPILISQLDSFLENVRVRLSSLYQELTTGEAKLFFHIYGRNGVMEEQEPVKDYKPIEVGILGEVVAKTQELANAICSNARIGVLHLPYPGQIATGGNLALPLNPPDNPIGPVCRFSIYHLMEVESPLELFTMRTMEV